MAHLKACAIHKAAEHTGLRPGHQDDFLVGTAISNGTLEAPNKPLLDLIAREFNAITAENCMKSGLLQPSQGQWEWELADRFVKFGLEHNMHIVGHALVWHSQATRDFFVHEDGRQISREELIRRTATQNSTLMERYKGKIATWDVANETIDEDKGWRQSLWYQVMGSAEYQERAFNLAHEIDPNAHLLYNDYNMHDPRSEERRVGKERRNQRRRQEE